jgi:hypothetical protein
MVTLHVAEDVLLGLEEAGRHLQPHLRVANLKDPVNIQALARPLYERREVDYTDVTQPSTGLYSHIEHRVILEIRQKLLAARVDRHTQHGVVECGAAIPGNQTHLPRLAPPEQEHLALRAEHVDEELAPLAPADIWREREGVHWGGAGGGGHFGRFAEWIFSRAENRAGCANEAQGFPKGGIRCEQS